VPFAAGSGYRGAQTLPEDPSSRYARFALEAKRASSCWDDCTSRTGRLERSSADPGKSRDATL